MLIISFLILINFANHFTESTLKQFFSERQRFNPNFEKAFAIIEKSKIKKLIFYTNKLMMKIKTILILLYQTIQKVNVK